MPTETELALRLGRDLGPLTTDAKWSVTATDDQPQGAYSDAIADALNDMGLASVSVATTTQYNELKDRALLHCLERLEIHYTTLVDSSTGQGEGGVTQKLSQIQQSITRVRGRVALAV